jgi:hypothetical protein
MHCRSAHLPLQLLHARSAAAVAAATHVTAHGAARRRVALLKLRQRLFTRAGKREMGQDGVHTECEGGWCRARERGLSCEGGRAQSRRRRRRHLHERERCREKKSSCALAYPPRTSQAAWRASLPPTARACAK